MDMREKGVYAEISAQVSMLVYAGGKREAVKNARAQLSEENIRLMKIKMVNGDGAPCWFRVEAIHAIEWGEAVWTGYTGKYRVMGRVRLTLNTKEELAEGSAAGASAASHTAYELPRSVVNDYAHWSVPATEGPVFLCVQSYEMAWRSEVEPEAAVLSMVG